MKNFGGAFFFICLFLGNIAGAQVRTVGNINERSVVKVALNFYSFNAPLMEGGETLESVIDFAASVGFAGVDITGYYFAGYPAAPADGEIYRIKYHAFRRGLEICGTGVRNDFALADSAARARERRLVKEWVVVAAKLGASTLRIFSGGGVPEGYEWVEVARWVAADIDECAEFAKGYGVVLAVQNHNDFLRTAEDVERLFGLIRSDAVGLMLDVGSFRSDPYGEVERTVRYAVSWQIKETLFVGGVEAKTDVSRIMSIIRDSGYCGCLPVEIIGRGNERERVRALFGEIGRGLK
ncbi:MAG: sugar phosphate isomerase/epimerase [Tannerellaceae bacterium]|jgi:hypothetical protein|nr:sugar phosphate isomerase/epimerase [Tannerellaceae bacterium]